MLVCSRFTSSWTLCVVLLVGFMAGGCATQPRLLQDEADYAETIARLEERIALNPNDADALRDLGIIYLRTSNYGQASDRLEAAFSRDPDDPKTLYHLGLTNEVLGKRETALRLYAEYPEVSRLSPYRRLMSGRYVWVVRQLREQEVQARLAEEARLQAQGSELCPTPPASDQIAVYPLDYQGDESRYAPLGRGMAELVSIDLSQVEGLELVERARLQDLLDEMRLSASEGFDPATAPRMGCLVGAGRLVGGVYNVLPGENLRLDAALWENEQRNNLDPQSDGLSRFMALEKRLVFDVLARMGIEPTPEERQRIERIPTQNLQAFLAYSRGLESEDAGVFGEAATYYRQATIHDPTFQLAQDKAEETEGMALAGGTLNTALTAAFQLDPTPGLVPAFGISPMTNLLNNLNINLEAGLVPGTGQRQPAEACVDGACAVGLPDPPDPPARSGNQ